MSWWGSVVTELNRLHSATVFEHPLGHGWILRKIAHEQVGAPEGKSRYWDEHEIDLGAKGAVIRQHDWEWAYRVGDSVGGPMGTACTVLESIIRM